MIRFVKLGETHLPEIKEWFKHDSISRWIAIDDWDAYYEYAANNPATHVFAIYGGDTFIGEFTAEKLDGGAFAVMLIIAPQYQNKGYGVRALRYFSENAAALLGCTPERLCAAIESGNAASITCFVRAGYSRRGTDSDGVDIYFFCF